MLLEWIHDGVVEYTSAMQRMRAYADDVAHGRRAPMVWTLQHEPVYTYGASFQYDAETHPLPAPLVKAHRGGDITYHGLDQLIVYPIIPLRTFGKNLHEYISFLESVVVRLCGTYGIKAFTLEGVRGIYTSKGKIGSVGVSCSRWVTTHGVSINVYEDREGFFDAIEPCGLMTPITSIAEAVGGVHLSEIVGRLKEMFD